MIMNGERLQVHPHCLMFLNDETGHEDFADPRNRVFGIGGCAVMAGAIDTAIKAPWRALKERYFGGQSVPLHAADLRAPTEEQLAALGKFFRQQEFGRFAVTMTASTSMPAGRRSFDVMPGIIRARWQELAARFQPTSVEVAFLHEASERGDPLIEEFFGELVGHIDGKTIATHHGLLPKSAGDESMEVADFIIQAAGWQAARWARGDMRIRQDFQAIFHANTLWSSFIHLDEVTESGHA
jgi:hypothetical protein